MKTNKALFLAGTMCVAAAVAALSQDKREQRLGPSPAASGAMKSSLIAVTNGPAASDYPVIGYIEKRGRTITIKAGPKGPLYSVKTTDGKVLFENLSAEQLQAKAPELHEFIKTAVAGNTAKGGSVVDASLGHPRAR